MLIAFIATLVVTSVVAQMNVPLCNPGSQALFNSLGQSPCTVAGYLGSACTGTQFTIPALPPDQVYSGPNKDNTNGCRCSSVYYSMLSACSSCQGGPFSSWSTYNANCTTVYLPSFPVNIPAGTAVPHYAYANVSIGDTFDITAAQSETGFPESTGTAVPTGPTTPMPSSSAGPAANSSGKSNTGAIAGGVVGGIVGAALLVGLVLWLIRRRRNRVAPSSLVHQYENPTIQSPPMSYASEGPPFSPSPRLYDPSDPSTFPTSPATSGTFGTGEHLMSPNHDTRIPPTAAQRVYTGAPEL